MSPHWFLRPVVRCSTSSLVLGRSSKLTWRSLSTAIRWALAWSIVFASVFCSAASCRTFVHALLGRFSDRICSHLLGWVGCCCACRDAADDGCWCCWFELVCHPFCCWCWSATECHALLVPNVPHPPTKKKRSISCFALTSICLEFWSCACIFTMKCRAFWWE